MDLCTVERNLMFPVWVVESRKLRTYGHRERMGRKEI
jgi:hypothetical protein